MIPQELLNCPGSDRAVRAGVVGTGEFATAIVTQSRSVPRLTVPVLADADVEAALRACRLAGLQGEQTAVCDTREAALRAIEHGLTVVLTDALLMMDLPVDVVVEATGVPEAGALHAREAIRNRKHVAMVNKEADVTVGPMLKHLADREGVVYTAVDGDQHGLLMGLVAWARGLGLEVLCGGKARDTELVLDEAAGTVSHHGTSIKFGADDADAFAPVTAGQVAQTVSARRSVLGDMARIGGYDIVEVVIAANATGLSPDAGGMHCPVLRVGEIPEVLCPVEDGGVLGVPGAVDVVTVLRRPDEAGLGGGVFIVVACSNEYSRRVLADKGLVFNSRGTAALICRPHHLCGVEACHSIVVAGLLGVPTGAGEYLPRFDVVAQATEDLKAGELVGNDHSPTLTALMRPAQRVAPGVPVPLHMANGNPLSADVPAGTVITTDMVIRAKESVLWSLRAEQDNRFLGPSCRS